MFTRYNGKFIASCEKVDDDSWLRSLCYKFGAIDGHVYSEFPQLEHNLLADISNHTDNGSVASFKHCHKFLAL